MLDDKTKADGTLFYTSQTYLSGGTNGRTDDDELGGLGSRLTLFP